MKEERENMQKGKPQNSKLKMTFAILFLAVLSIVELYLMMNYPKEYIFLGIAALGILCLVYIVTDLTFKVKQEREEAYVKDYESIYKAQKVSYVFMKQSFMDMEEILEKIKVNTEVPADELIEAQKAVGKITIKKNRENTASVLNSNEKVISQMTSFEENMKNMIHSMEESMSSPRPEISGGQQDIIENLEKNQAALKEEISRLKEQIDLKNSEILDAVKSSVSESAAILEKRISSEISVQVKANSVSAEMIAGKLKETVVPSETVEIDANIASEPVASEESIAVEENAAASEPIAQKEPIAAEKNAAPGSIVQEEPIAAEENAAPEPIVQKELTASGESAAPEPIAQKELTASEESAVSEPIAQKEPIASEENVSTPESIVPEELTASEESAVSESIAQKEPIAEEENVSASESFIPEESIAVEKSVAPEPVAAEENVVPETKETLEEIAASGKIMTPEEIASLLEQTDAAMEVQEPVKEEKAPDLSSDPGHVMTPEEIAALLANM